MAEFFVKKKSFENAKKFRVISCVVLSALTLERTDPGILWTSSFPLLVRIYLVFSHLACPFVKKKKENFQKEKASS